MHIMLDVETFGKKPGCVVLSIGAIVFDPYRNTFSTPVAPAFPPMQPPPMAPAMQPVSFYRNIDLLSSLFAGLKIDPETVEWWRGQSDEAKSALTTGAQPLRDVCEGFLAWCASVAGADPLYVWAKSPDFDCSVWEAASEAVGIAAPWTFRSKRDVRTAMDMGRVNEKDYPPMPGAHIALDDCSRQIAFVQDAYMQLKPPVAPVIPGVKG